MTEPRKETTGVDISWLLRNVGGNELLVRKLLEMFKNSLTASLKEINASAASGDRIRLARQVHSLKGTAATVGARGVCQISSEVELMANGAEMSQITEGIQRLARCCDEAEKIIEAYMKQGM